MYGQFQCVRWGGGGGRKGHGLPLYTQRGKKMCTLGGRTDNLNTYIREGGWRRTTLNHNFIIPMGGWVDGWVVGGTNYTNVNLWGQTTLVYYRGTENLSMYYRGRTI